MVVTGSENDDIVGLPLPDGKEVFRFSHNGAAKSGIDCISILGDRLLVATSPVGASDHNIRPLVGAAGAERSRDRAARHLKVRPGVGAGRRRGVLRNRVKG